jgi:uncharacterized protein (TIGR02145 family)
MVVLAAGFLFADNLNDAKEAERIAEALRKMEEAERAEAETRKAKAEAKAEAEAEKRAEEERAKQGAERVRLEREKIKNSRQQFTDPRDGKKYLTVKIGGKAWMAENMNYKTGKSWCYDNKDSNCDKYGRLYDWKTAMKKACPNGWHLPNIEEWDILVGTVGGQELAVMKVESQEVTVTQVRGQEVTDRKRQLEARIRELEKKKEKQKEMAGENQNGANKADIAGKPLKSTSGWERNENGTDVYGFSALPGGNRTTYGSFSHAGSNGYWWTATEYGSGGTNIRVAGYGRVIANRDDKGDGYSVRCIGDN